MHEPGTVFEGRYEIESLLGAGGWGEVFRARQLSTGQPVAIKTIRAEGVAPARLERMRSRFQRETQICAALRHPNIVALLDAGVSEDGRLYSVFAYVPGRDLRLVLKEEQRLSSAETVHLAGQVLDALAAAHGAGVVHRDIKPGNVMVTTSGARRNATVLDFGIGALLKPMKDEALAQLTATEEFVGTVAYAAPEQLRGGRPTPRSDLYAWGLLVLECLTGEPVMSGTSPTEIALKQLGAEPIPIPRPWRDHALGRLIARAVVKDVDRRDVTAESLLHELSSLDVSDLPDASGPALEETAGAADTGVAPATPRSGTRRSSAYTWKHVEGDRRQLTAACIRIGVVAHGEVDLDVEEFDEVLNDAVEVCRATADRLGARIRTGLGDRVMLYFGIPEAREDDPRRAVLAAADVIRALASPPPPGRTARADVGVGIDTGLVIARDAALSAGGADDVVGATPTVAAQLSVIAEPGQVLLSERTAKLVRRHAAAESIGSRLLGGLARPLQVFRLLDTGSGGVSSQAVLAEDATPIVGRDGELAMARARWEQTRRGEGQALFVSGEPGIGKSRITREIIREVERGGAPWIEVRCLAEARHNTLRPFVDWLERALRFEPTWDDARRRAALESYLEVRQADLPTAVPLLGGLLGLGASERFPPLEASPQKQRELALEVLVGLLFDRSADGPLLLVIEDAHWADPTSAELMAKLVERAPSAPICVLVTARPEFQPTWPATAALPIQLTRLAPPAVETLLTNIGGGRPFPAAVAAEIVRRADGVSLFVEELAQAVLEAGIVQAVDGELRQKRPLTEADVPLTLRDLLMARLDRTGQAAETAQIAAVIGREFELDMLAAASSASPEAIARHLEVLRSADLVRQLWRRAGEPAAFEFKHALVRDMAYASLRRANRMSVHGRVAAVIEERYPETVRSRPDLLAWHHGEAGHFSAALTYAEKAGAAALARSANKEALAQVARAKEWLPGIESEVERASRELALNNIATPALMATGGWANDEIRRTVERSERLLPLIGAAPAAFAPAYALTLFHHVARNPGPTLQLSDRLRHISDEIGDVSLRVLAAATTAQTWWIHGDYRHSFTDCRFVEEHYDRTAHRTHGALFGIDSLAYAYVIRGQYEWFCGQPDAGRRTTWEGVEWARETKHAASTALMLLYVLLVEAYREDRAALVKTADEVLAMADRYGLPAQQAYAGVMRAWASGDRAAIEQVLGFLGALGCRLGLTFYHALPADLAHAAGEHTAALGMLDRCLALCDELGEHYYEAELHRRRAAVLLAADPGATAAAEDGLQRALAVSRSQGTATLELHAALDLARLFAARGDRAAAHAVLAAAAPKVEGGADLAFVREARALLTELS